MENVDKLIEELERLMETGDETAARKFVIDHFNEFSPEAQRELAVELFQEAMAKDLAERETIAGMKKELVDALEALDKAEEQKT